MSFQFADLSGLRAVVTGASSGIGHAITYELARGGADTIVHCRSNVDLAALVAEEIRSLGRRCEVIAADISDLPRLELFVEDAWSRFGRIDVWINNAGSDVLTGDAAKLDYEQKLQQLLDVDLRGTMLLSRMIGRKMVDAGSGVILNLGWDQAAYGMEGGSGELFGATKNGVMGFSRALALSLAPSVRVNCIAPGWIRTAWGEQASEYWQERVRQETPLQRWGEPKDVAALARFLASPDAAYLTGQVINVNGGAVR